jgi:hypothetical protein
MGIFTSKEEIAEAKAEEEEKKRRCLFVRKDQSSPFLNGLWQCFEDHSPKNAEDTLKLLEKKVYSMDPDSIFTGAIYFQCNHQYLISRWGELCSDYYKLIRSNNYWEPDNTYYLLIDGAKPYLLAFLFAVLDKAWLQVFVKLLKYSNVDIIKDQLFGWSAFEHMTHFVAPEPLTSKAQEKNTVQYCPNIFRQIFKGVVFDNAETICRYIRNDYENMLTDILDVCDCKEMLSKNNFLFEIARVDGRTHLIRLFLNKGQDVYQKLDGIYCFLRAVEYSNSSDFLYYLNGFDILSYLNERLLHAMYENKLSYECFETVISKANEIKRDIVKEKDPEGRTLLILICETNKPESQDQALIKLLISWGADIYESWKGKRVIDIVFAYNMPGFVIEMIDWEKEHKRIHNKVSVIEE